MFWRQTALGRMFLGDCTHLSLKVDRGQPPNPIYFKGRSTFKEGPETQKWPPNGPIWVPRPPDKCTGGETGPRKRFPLFLRQRFGIEWRRGERAIVRKGSRWLKKKHQQRVRGRGGEDGRGGKAGSRVGGSGAWRVKGAWEGKRRRKNLG